VILKGSGARADPGCVSLRAGCGLMIRTTSGSAPRRHVDVAAKHTSGPAAAMPPRPWGQGNPAQPTHRCTRSDARTLRSRRSIARRLAPAAAAASPVSRQAHDCGPPVMLRNEVWVLSSRRTGLSDEVAS